jgi:hypothetical protein
MELKCVDHIQLIRTEAARCCCWCVGVQVHWVFGAKLQNHSVALSNASLHLMHEDPPAGEAGVQGFYGQA